MFECLSGPLNILTHLRERECKGLFDLIIKSFDDQIPLLISRGKVF